MAQPIVMSLRDWTGGNAEDNGETCVELPSKPNDDILASVRGTTPVAETLPMNHD